MEDRADWLMEAAITGNVEFLWDIIKEDRFILDKFVAGRYTWSPLHVAASCGHTNFVQELVCFNPELVEVPDSRYRSALHLASAKGHMEIVKTLIGTSPKMCLARDRDGRNPLHYAAEEGKVEVLKELVRASPTAARARVDRDETILHLCVKNKQLKTLDILIERIIDEEFVNAKDNCGNTILHVAVLEKQVETVRHVLKYSKIDVNATNANGHTSMDLLIQTTSSDDQEDMEQVDHNLKDFLLRANGKRAKQLIKFDWLERKDILMVVASVIATMTFQAAVNPPGGVWQDNSDVHRAGESVIAYNHPGSYPSILRANTIGFLASLSSMFLLTNVFPFGKRAFRWILIVMNWLIITSMAISYAFSIGAVTPGEDKEVHSNNIVVAVVVWCGGMTLLLLMHTFGLVRDLINEQWNKIKAVERIWMLGLSGPST